MFETEKYSIKTPSRHRVFYEDLDGERNPDEMFKGFPDACESEGDSPSEAHQSQRSRRRRQHPTTRRAHITLATNTQTANAADNGKDAHKEVYRIAPSKNARHSVLGGVNTQIGKILPRKKTGMFGGVTLEETKRSSNDGMQDLLMSGGLGDLEDGFPTLESDDAGSEVKDTIYPAGGPRAGTTSGPTLDVEARSSEHAIQRQEEAIAEISGPAENHSSLAVAPFKRRGRPFRVSKRGRPGRSIEPGNANHVTHLNVKKEMKEQKQKQKQKQKVEAERPRTRSFAKKMDSVGSPLAGSGEVQIPRIGRGRKRGLKEASSDKVIQNWRNEEVRIASGRAYVLIPRGDVDGAA